MMETSSSSPRPSVRLLGPIELSLPDGIRASLPLQRRKIMALLCISPQAPLPAIKLVDLLWSGNVPKRAPYIVREHLRMLRGLLGKEVLTRTSSGYVIDPCACDIDAVRFKDLFKRAQHYLGLGDRHEAFLALDESLSIWQGGEAMTDVRDVPKLDLEAICLESLYFNACELSAECLIAAKRSAEAIPLLLKLTVSHPQREIPWLLLMVAEATAGRLRDALELTYGQARHHLVESTGLDMPRLSLIQEGLLRGVSREELLDLLRMLPMPS
jgi:DNA-binding SARP family transcriptional activator